MYDFNQSMPCEYVKAIIERRATDADKYHMPRVMTKWWGEGLWNTLSTRLNDFAAFSEDVAVISFPQPSFEARDDGFCWRLPEFSETEKQGLDSKCRLPDWSYLGELCDNPPNTDASGIFDDAVTAAKTARERGQYVVMHHWELMFEKIWRFRGMENLFTDYYDEPENVHRLHALVLDTELKLLKRAAELIKPDDYFISDDLGSQRALMMSPDCFREFIKPYYKRLWGTAHKYGMHTWLHSCGCITEIIDDLIECGLDVIHPVQKHTMDWDKIASDYKGKITFLAGMDVQQTLRFGTADDVRAEVKLIRKTFGSPNGGLLIAAGNGITGGTPYENIAAFLDEISK